jgi:hypothetical protein
MGAIASQAGSFMQRSLLLPIFLLAVTGLIAPDAVACNPACRLETKMSPVMLNGSIPIFGTASIASADPASSFRGLRLGLTRAQAEAVVREAGFGLAGVVQDDPNMDICDGTTSVGTVRFDAAGRVRKLEFKPEYFFAGGSGLRDFADRLFQHYNVASPGAKDDVCFPGLTCFRGRSPAGENFMLLNITQDVQLHVQAAKFRPQQ